MLTSSVFSKWRFSKSKEKQRIIADLEQYSTRERIAFSRGKWRVGNGRSIQLWEDRWTPIDVTQYQHTNSLGILLDTLIDETNRR